MSGAEDAQTAPAGGRYLWEDIQTWLADYGGLNFRSEDELTSALIQSAQLLRRARAALKAQP